MSGTERPTLAEDGWIEEVREALAAADAHTEHDRAEYVAGQLVNFVCRRETASEQRTSERVTKLHRPTDADVVEDECSAARCDHDVCPEKRVQVCLECDGIREAANDEGNVVLWPCATIRALDGTTS